MTLLDLSWTGARVALERGDLDGCDPTLLGRISRRLRNFSSLKLIVELDPPRLGSLISRALHITRLGNRRRDSDIVELGCTFVPPLTDDEVRALGLPLPRESEPADVARRLLDGMEHPAPRPEAEPEPQPAVQPAPEHEPLSVLQPEVEEQPMEPRPPVPARLSVCVRAYEALRVPVLRGQTVGVGSEGAVVLVHDEGNRARFCKAKHIADRVVLFYEQYGKEVEFTIEDGGRFLFHGPVTVVGIDETAQAPGELRLAVSFGRHLEQSELRGLGLAPDSSEDHPEEPGAALRRLKGLVWTRF